MTTAPADIRNIAVIGHKASGKTSLAEAMLFVAKATPKLGKVDDKTSLLDDAAEEKEHAASLEASVAHLTWGGRKVNLVDTPGEGSFLAETRLALGAVDAALLVVSGKDGVQPITERVFGWARSQALPTVIVVTKVDAENAKPDEVVAEIRARLKAPVAVMELCVGEGVEHQGVVTLRTRKAWLGKAETPATAATAVPDNLAKQLDDARAKLVDDVAGSDDDLTEKYLTEGDLTQEELDKGLREAVVKGGVVPIYFASGTRPSGIAALLDGLVELVPPPTAHPPFAGTVPGKGTDATRGGEGDPTALFVFKTSIDQHAGRTSFARVLSGTVKADSQLLNAATGNPERIGKIATGAGKDAKATSTRRRPATSWRSQKLKATLSGHGRSRTRRHAVSFHRARGAAGALLTRREVRGQGRRGEGRRRAPPLDRRGSRARRHARRGDARARRERPRRAAPRDHGRAHPPARRHRLPPRPAAHRLQGDDQPEGHERRGQAQEAVRRTWPIRRAATSTSSPVPRGGGFIFEDAVVGGSIPRQFIPSRSRRAS